MGTHKTQYKSAEFIESSDNDDTIELTSSESSSSLSEFEDSRSNSGSSTAADRTLVALLPARDSIDRELDAMEQIPVPSQHKAPNPEPKPRHKRAKKDKALADTVQEPIQKPEAVILTITYNISLFPAAEMRKDLKKRRGQGTYLKLAADEPFDTFKAQLLVKIDNEMKPATISFDNYIVSFTIPRLSPSPLAITNQKDYDELIARVKKAKDLTATVYVQEMQNVKKRKEIQSGKENDSATSDGSDSDSSDNDGRKKRKRKDKRKKTRAPKASDIDESNQPVNKNIRDLRNRWICHKKPGCESEFCFVNPADGGSHIPLTFPRLECWASAILKGPATATLEKPPNHSHFSMVPEELLGQQSVLALRRQQLDEQARLKASSTGNMQNTPVINVNFPPELFHTLRALEQAPTVALPPVLRPPAPVATSLLSLAQLAAPGPRMCLADFCVAYEISETLQTKLLQNGFSSSHSFRFTSLEDLESIGLLRGEVAQLRDAVSRWCGE